MPSASRLRPFFLKHKRLPYLLALLVPALLFFLYQGQRYYQSRHTLREIAAIKTSGQWYRYGADRNVREAQYNLGLLYHRGFTVPQSDTEAVKWLQKAADQNLATAQNELGTYYEEGTGVAINQVTAAKLYHRAAEQGFPPAMDNLADLHLEGLGVPEDQAAAFEWYENAARLGYAPSQLSLAAMNESSNPKNAYAWASVTAVSARDASYITQASIILARLAIAASAVELAGYKTQADLYIKQYGPPTEAQFENIKRRY